MTISLPPTLEARLNDAAARRGMPVQEYAAQLIEQALVRPSANQKTLQLLAQWDAEDATDDPQEIARRRKEAEEFMQGLARNRIEMEGPNARKLWP